MNYFTFRQVFSRMHYPAGESHVRQFGHLGINGSPVIEATVRNFEDLCNLLTADRILKRARRTPRWFVPYFPFARHDRRVDDQDGLELELALELVRDLDITIVDPHSDVAGMLRNIPQAAAVSLFEKSGLFPEDCIVVIPDAGATKKASTWLGQRESIQCAKARNPKTGKLSGFQVPSSDLGGRPCVIIDDICDGGATFLGLAKALKQAGAGPLSLGVSHGLFTKGLQDLDRHFTNIMAFVPTGETSHAPFQALSFQSLYSQGEY